MSAYFTARVLKNEKMGRSVQHLTLRLEVPISYEPGQFFLLRLRNSQGDDVERSYSAANHSSEGTVEFVIRIEPEGQMSKLIHLLGHNATVDIKGPFGTFGFLSLPENAEKLILIAGGVGIAPFRSMIQQWSSQGKKIPIQLLYGFRTSQDFLFQEEFQNLKNLDIVSAISDPDPSWEGNKGTITEFLEKYVDEALPETHAFICGPPLMVKAAREKLFSLGFDRKQVHVEAW